MRAVQERKVMRDSTTCALEEIHEERLKRASERLPSEEALLAMAHFFHLLGDPTRLKILMALMEVELCVCDLAEMMGVSQPAISQHLRLLRDARLVSPRKEGRNVYYRPEDEHVHAALALVSIHVQEETKSEGSFANSRPEGESKDAQKGAR